MPGHVGHFVDIQSAVEIYQDARKYRNVAGEGMLVPRKQFTRSVRQLISSLAGTPWA